MKPQIILGLSFLGLIPDWLLDQWQSADRILCESEMTYA